MKSINFKYNLNILPMFLLCYWQHRNTLLNDMLKRTTNLLITRFVSIVHMKYNEHNNVQEYILTKYFFNVNHFNNEHRLY